jgi:hypothetical protein
METRVHVVVWEASCGAAACGPFPGASEAEEWWLPLAPFVVPKIRASVAVVVPAHEFRSDDGTAPGGAETVCVVQHGTRLDRLACGYLVDAVTGEEPSMVAGVFSARGDAAAWWSSQARALKKVHGRGLQGRVLPLVPVPSWPDAFTKLFVGTAGGLGRVDGVRPETHRQPGDRNDR